MRAGTPVLCLALIVTLAASAGGCIRAEDDPALDPGPGPGLTVENFWLALQAGDYDSAGLLTTVKVGPQAVAARLFESQILGREALDALVRTVSIEVTGETLSGDTAEVHLSVGMPDPGLLVATACHLIPSLADPGRDPSATADAAFIAAMDEVLDRVPVRHIAPLSLIDGQWRLTDLPIPTIRVEHLDHRLGLALGLLWGDPPGVSADELLGLLAGEVGITGEGPSSLGAAVGLDDEGQSVDTRLGRLDILRLPGDMPLGAWETEPGEYTLFPWALPYAPCWGPTLFMTGLDFLLAVDASLHDLVWTLRDAGTADMGIVVLDPPDPGERLTHWTTTRACQTVYPGAPGADMLVVYVGDIDYSYISAGPGHNVAEVTGDRHRIHVMFAKPPDPRHLEEQLDPHLGASLEWLDARSLVVEVPGPPVGHYGGLGPHLEMGSWADGGAADLDLTLMFLESRRQQVWPVDPDSGLAGDRWTLHQPLRPLAAWDRSLLLERLRGTYATCEAKRNLYILHAESGGVRYAATVTGVVSGVTGAPGVFYSSDDMGRLIRLDCRGQDAVTATWPEVSAVDPSCPDGRVLMIATHEDSAALISLDPETRVETVVVGDLPPSPWDPVVPGHSVFWLEGGRAVLVLCDEASPPDLYTVRWLAVELETGRTWDLEPPADAALWHWHPMPLPDGRYVLTVETRPTTAGGRHLSLAVDLETGSAEDLSLPADGHHTWSPDSHLVFVEGRGVHSPGGTLLAAVSGMEALWSPCSRYVATDRALWDRSGGIIAATGGRPVCWDAGGELWLVGYE